VSIPNNGSGCTKDGSTDLNTEKIIFIQTAFPGDAILTLPALNKLMDFFPDSKIDVLCIPTTKEIFEASPVVSSVIVIDKKGKHKSLISTYKFIKQLKQNNYTRIYSSHRSLRTALIVHLLEVKETFGFNNSILMHVYKSLIPYCSSKHEIQRNFDLIGFEYDEQSWRIIPEIISNERTVEKIKSFINKNDLTSGFIAIAPGSVWNTKKYPSEYFEVIMKHFVDRKINIVLIGGENDRAINDIVVSKFSGNVFNTAGDFSIVESIELLKTAKLLLSNDSAPTHMGMCADIKVLTIYCSTVPEFGFYPYNKKSTSISFNGLKCKPCGIHGHNMCPIKTFDCAMKLLPDQIILKAEEMLSD
jgi:heptosyltransferase II